jgi:hypothetical protein
MKLELVKSIKFSYEIDLLAETKLSIIDAC